MVDNIHTLIHSLSKSEKRYFKLFTGFHQGSKNYVRLFDEIMKQKVYDEKAIKERFRAERFVKNFAVAKKNLYEQVLKALRMYYSGKTVDTKILEHISNIHVLYNKGLSSLCVREIKEAKRLAIAHNRYTRILELIDLELSIKGKFVPGKKQEAFINDNWIEKTAILEEEKKLSDITRLSYLGFFYYNKVILDRSYIDLGKFEQINQNALFRDEQADSSFSVRLQYHNMRGIYQQLKGNNESFYKELIKIAELLEANHEFIKTNPEQYLTGIHNAAVACIDIYNEEEALRYINKLEEIQLTHKVKLNDSLRIHVFKLSFYLKLHLYNKSGKFRKSSYLLKDQLSVYQKMNDRIDEFWKMKINYEIAYTYFGELNFNAALDWINEIVHQSVIDWKSDTYHVNLLNFLLHYELKNYSLMDSIARTLIMKMKKSKRISMFEKIVIDTMNFIIKDPGHSLDRKKMTSILNRLEKSADDPMTRIMFDQLELYSWLTAKLKGISFSEAVRHQVALNAK